METGKTIEDILNTIIPPREYSVASKGQVWVQTTVSVPATRNEVIQLKGFVFDYAKNSKPIRGTLEKAETAAGQ